MFEDFVGKGENGGYDDLVWGLGWLIRLVLNVFEGRG